MPREIAYRICTDIGNLPHFNAPAADEPLPEPVQRLLKGIDNADAVLICTPEYAFGIPGSLKNLLDWTVGTGKLVDKPVALITASSKGDDAHASLLKTLGALSAKVPEECILLIPFIRAKMDNTGNVTDEATLQQLKDVHQHLLNAIV